MLESLFRGVAAYQARRSLTRYEGKIVLDGLHRKVRVVFEPTRVPHIIAETVDDLFFAQGYVHAMERLWQMELGRRATAGRLAETFGNQTLDWKDFTVRLRGLRLADVDFFMRVLRLRHAATAAVAAAPDASREIMERYAQGVNAYLESRSHRQLPVEYRLLGLEPEPWTAVDSVSIARGMAYELNVSWKTILIQHGIQARVPAELAEGLLPAGYAAGEPLIALAAGIDRPLLALDGAAREFLGWRGTGMGSNNWVLSGSRTASGAPLVCCDPHLRLRAPSTWYLAHLAGGPYDVVGATIPGLPGVTIGRNRYVAWGVTSSMLHDADLFRERLDPERPDRYLSGSEWRPMEVTEEVIAINKAPSVTRRVRSTPRGPLLSDALPEWSNVPTEALAMKWTAHDPSDELAALLAVDRARSCHEVDAALRSYGCPSLSFVFADADNIGFRMAGSIPIRRSGTGEWPAPGWTGEGDWIGYVPFEETPHLLNPDGGYIATANNQVTDDSYPYFISNLWEPAYRIRRIHQMLAARGRHSAKDMKHMQADVVALQAVDFIDDVLRPWASGRLRLSRPARAALEALLAWDGTCDTDSGPAAIFHALHDQLLRQVFGGPLGEDLLLAYIEHYNESTVKLERLLRRPDSPWFAPRGRDAALAKALEATVAWLKKTLGDKMGSWQWGSLHQATMAHAMGGTPVTASFFNIGPSPTPGSTGTVNSGQFFYSNPFRHCVGSGYRQIADLSADGESWFVNNSGQSGNPTSPHYRDLHELWRDCRYIPMSLEVPEGEELRLLKLQPAAVI